MYFNNLQPVDLLFILSIITQNPFLNTMAAEVLIFDGYIYLCVIYIYRLLLSADINERLGNFY